MGMANATVQSARNQADDVRNHARPRKEKHEVGGTGDSGNDKCGATQRGADRLDAAIRGRHADVVAGWRPQGHELRSSSGE